jgi:imidazolonepropionase-like amidohydrolase
MLDELRAAAGAGQLSPAALFRAATTDAARLLRATSVGALAVGYAPDLFIAPRWAADPYENLLRLCAQDLITVFVRGVRVTG